MIYKFKDGGVIKLQNAGSLPKWMQKLNSWSSKNIPQSDESIGERIQNKTIEEANSAKTQEERDKIYKDSAKTNLAVTGQSLMMLPMLGEFTTYGLLGGGLRIGTGMAGSKAGEYVLGKGGDWADKQLNTNFLGTTGRIIGGLGGWWGGSSATTPLFRNLAGKGITLHIPQETFMHLRGQYFDRAANKAFAKASPDVVQMNIESGKIGWAPSVNKIMWHNSNDPISQLDINYPAWDVVEKNAPLGHSWLTGLETTQGFLGERPYHLRSKIDLNKPMVQIGEAIGDGKNTTRNQILDFAQKSSADGINFQGIADNTLKNQDVYAVFKGVDLSPSKIILEPDKYWYVGHQTSSINFPSIHKNGLHTTNGLSGTATLVNQNFIDEFLNGNLKKLHLSHEGSNGLVLMKFPKDKFPKADLDDISFRLMDLGESSDFEVPSKYMTFLKQEQESPFSIDPVIKPIDPQEAATTYHFDGSMPLSRPISQAERLGVPKGDRGLFDWGQISDLRPRFNKWAEYYGYDQIPESVELENAVDIMRNTFKRHNTFFRGVHKPDTPEDIAHIESLFGKGYNLDDVYKYVATHGRLGDNAVFVSPLSNAGIYGSTGKTAIVRRRFKLGRNPETWLQDADFDIIFGGSPEAIKTAQQKGTLTFPWDQRGRGIVENELLAPDGTINFIDFIPRDASASYFDLNGSLNKYLGYKSFHDVYGFGDYNRFTDIPVEKPKFKQGGKI